MTGGGRQTAQYRLPCPRCAGPITTFEGAAALACPHCGGRFFLGADGSVGWLAIPRLRPAETRSPAKRWLRDRGQRVTRIDEPVGVLIPLFWARGEEFAWEIVPAVPWNQWRVPRSEHDMHLSMEGLFGTRANEPADADLVESRLSIRSYRHALPAHPAASRIRGLSTRVESQTLILLDPDRLPAGYTLLPPASGRTEAEAAMEEWLERWRRRGSGRAVAAASAGLQHRLNLVAWPLGLVPYAFRSEHRGVVLVDAVSGSVAGSLTGDDAERLIEVEEDGPIFWRTSLGSPVLLPLDCRTCGWVLPLRERERLHPCRHCGACWELRGDAPVEVRQWFLDRRPDRDGRWLPFWAFGEGEHPAEFLEDGILAPAYQARHPEPQVHLAARLSGKAIGTDWLDQVLEPPDGAAVDSAQAVGWRWAVEGSLARRETSGLKRFLSEETPGGNRSSGPRCLVWIPFRREGGDLVEPNTGARVRASSTTPWESRPAA